jgi:single-strand selective monofunctional uracil DNA glycosylase
MASPLSPVQIARRLSSAVNTLPFAPPITHVYNPLDYARHPHEAYLKAYARPGIEVMLVGMNPGPWGMAQTGVPFGEVSIVRDWLGIDALWGWAREQFKTPDAFFTRFFVHNYCPLCFMEAGGKNFTPDKLPKAQQERLFAPCDDALRALVAQLNPALVVGVGGFAEARIRASLSACPVRIGRILHPSPASPAANRGWAAAATAELRALGVGI